MHNILAGGDSLAVHLRRGGRIIHVPVSAQRRGTGNAPDAAPSPHDFTAPSHQKPIQAMMLGCAIHVSSTLAASFAKFTAECCRFPRCVRTHRSPGHTRCRGIRSSLPSKNRHHQGTIKTMLPLLPLPLPIPLLLAPRSGTQVRRCRCCPCCCCCCCSRHLLASARASRHRLTTATVASRRQSRAARTHGKTHGKTHGNCMAIPWQSHGNCICKCMAIEGIMSRPTACSSSRSPSYCS